MWTEQQEILTKSLIVNDVNCRQLSVIGCRNKRRERPDQGESMWQLLLSITTHFLLPMLSPPVDIAYWFNDFSSDLFIYAHICIYITIYIYILFLINSFDFIVVLFLCFVLF